jgi:very-short-patch-repair endonuclease
MTLPEKRLWDALRKLDARIRRQVPIGAYVVDFACHEAKLIVELDGPVHAFPDKQARDASRNAWLTGQGYRLLRFANAEIMDDLYRVVEQIEAAVSPSSPALLPSREKGE